MHRINICSLSLSLLWLSACVDSVKKDICLGMESFLEPLSLQCFANFHCTARLCVSVCVDDERGAKLLAIIIIISYATHKPTHTFNSLKLRFLCTILRTAALERIYGARMSYEKTIDKLLSRSTQAPTICSCLPCR